MPTRIKLILETAVAAGFISIEDVFEYGYDYKFHWSELASKICQIAYMYRYRDYPAWQTIVKEAECFWSEWKLKDW